MPAPGDAHETRRRLVEAAHKEFAAYGVAGARVDRIAAAAGCNKALIYFHFGSKDGLFDAVFDRIVAYAVAEAPIDADDLPEYAGRLYDASRAHPEVARLATWYRLERAADRPPLEAIVNAHHDKIAAIAKAQEAGRVTDRFRPAELLALVLTIANMWTVMSPEIHIAAGEDPETQRHLVVEAVRTLVNAR